ncbi:MAG: EamA family transporter RarD [Proteobacteria bacterium]|nr:MAG: EamA family transporter RarD [Pseudomonadota bacterium]
MPLYWKALAALPAIEILLHRIVGTLVFACLLLTAARRWDDVRAVLGVRRRLVALAASSLLIATNWLVFIWAVHRGEIVATSLGYYLNPLMNVALGMFVLRERLRALQLLAVAIAAVGVAYLSASLGGLPWISLYLAGSFALYGLIRKTVAVASIAGLAVETAMIAPFAAIAIGWREAAGEGAFSRTAELAPAVPWLLLGAGVVTALPLVWFASAARRVRLATLGLFQYIAPSLALAIAVLVYGEPFTHAHAVAFGCIWTALALYSLESMRALRAIDRLRR